MADKDVLSGDDFYLAYSTDGGTTKVQIPGWRRFAPGLKYREINTEAGGDAIKTGKPGRLDTMPKLTILKDKNNDTELDVLLDAHNAKTTIGLYWAREAVTGAPLYGLSVYVSQFETAYEQQKEQEIEIEFMPADPDWISDPASATLSLA